MATVTRRLVSKALLAMPLWMGTRKLLAQSKAAPAEAKAIERVSAVVIGSGFGGSITALRLAHRFKARDKNEKVVMLERGAWWTTPVATVEDPKVLTPGFLRDKHGQPVHYWPSLNDSKGVLDILNRCVRGETTPEGLYEFNALAGVSVLRASGVGGGSLVYANITIEPPASTFSDTRWPLTWSDAERAKYFDRARFAIGYGVLSLLTEGVTVPNPDPKRLPNKQYINTGLSQIRTRTAALDPAQRDLWLSRARVFQDAMAKIGGDGGSVYSSINDLPVGASGFGHWDDPKKLVLANYCEREGRCVVGCLPGARHTLNKQLMRAALGKPKAPDETPPLAGALEIRALAEARSIRRHLEGGYVVTYRDHRGTAKEIHADIVIVAAGCLGTNELLLRSTSPRLIKNKSERLALSPKLGYGFSPNGDYIGFLEGTKDLVYPTKGPITTSYGHFNAADGSRFHTIEDNGIPPSLAALAGKGVSILRKLLGDEPLVAPRTRSQQQSALEKVEQEAGAQVSESDRKLKAERRPVSEHEKIAKMMCVTAMGRDKAVGRFTLNFYSNGEPYLAVKRTDGLRFADDPIYAEIRGSLDKLAQELKGTGARFVSPFQRTVASSHPLGGCAMAKSAADGVVDELGRVFDPAGGVHDGLYVADGSIIPTSLGVNPSLTISALALRIAEKLVERFPG